MRNARHPPNAMLAGLLLCLMLGAGLLIRSPGSDAAEDPRPLAVWFYADWCTNCKLLAPKYAQARAGFDDRVRFVTLDVTNESTKDQSRVSANALGIAPLYFANHATGWVALVDAQRKQVDELHYDESVDDMRASLARLADGSGR